MIYSVTVDGLEIGKLSGVILTTHIIGIIESDMQKKLGVKRLVIRGEK